MSSAIRAASGRRSGRSWDLPHGGVRLLPRGVGFPAPRPVSLATGPDPAPSPSTRKQEVGVRFLRARGGSDCEQRRAEPIVEGGWRRANRGNRRGRIPRRGLRGGANRGDPGGGAAQDGQAGWRPDGRRRPDPARVRVRGGRGDAAAAGLGGLGGHEPHGGAGDRRGGRRGRGAAGPAAAADAVAAQRPRPHAPRPRQGVLRVPARHHRAGGGRDPRGGPAGGGRRHPGGVAADGGGPLEQREGAAGARHRPVAAHLQVRLHRAAVPAGGAHRPPRRGHHLLRAVPVPPEVAQQARRPGHPDSVGQAEPRLLHTQVEPLVHRHALRHVRGASDGRCGREDGLSVPIGELQVPADPSCQESPEGESPAGTGHQRAGPGAAAPHRDLRGAHVLHQQRGEAGLFHDQGQDRLLGCGASESRRPDRHGRRPARPARQVLPIRV